MQNRLWLFSIPIVSFFGTLLLIYQMGESGSLQNHFLRESVFPGLRTLTGQATNIKFKIRGPTPPANKVVIVDVDDLSLEQIGRWPWHRNVIAELLHQIFKYNPKVVGFDIVFSEPDPRVPQALAEQIQEAGIPLELGQFETDDDLVKALAQYRDRTVLGWLSDVTCQPAFLDTEQCPVAAPEVLAAIPPLMPKFAYQSVETDPAFNPAMTAIPSLVLAVTNMISFQAVSTHAATFQAFPDPDGYIRRTSLALLFGGVPYPTLPLEMARVARNEELAIKLTDDHQIDHITWANSGIQIPATRLGAMKINFRGPSGTFPYVSVFDILTADGEVPIKTSRQLASQKSSLHDLLNDAYVLIGVSARGVFDLRAFPFDSNTPGVEGHANILDNLLSDDMYLPTNSGIPAFVLWVLLIVGGIGFAYVTQRLEAIPAIALFGGMVFVFGLIDQKLLFEQGYDLATSLIYLEYLTLFLSILSAKYILEEKNKKFIRGAFSKYVAPTIVDSILKDPAGLTVGGQRKDLTILFSDIRGFTSLSETMDAKTLSEFLNDYLGFMTEVIFEYNGTLDKYIGDAIMAFWGAPLDQSQHASYSLKCAQQMMIKLEEVTPEFQKKYGKTIDIGIGLNSGTVSVGNMGSDRIFEYTAIGDHVNLASRLEGLTKYYGVKIITSEHTIRSIVESGEQPPDHRVIDQVKVKGKKNSVQIVEVLYRSLSPEGLDAFEKGRQHYLNRQWDDAIRSFHKASSLISAKNPQNRQGPDRPSKMYIDRSEEFKQNPPDSDWDGSWEMSSK